MKNARALGPVLLLLATTAGGCGDDSEASDLAAPVGDMAVEPDLSVYDQATPDTAVVPDLMPPCDADAGVPTTLACSGLYADWNAKTLASGVQAFAPGHTLWSDGAIKSRFVQIPQGATIDTTAANDWVFPVGTKFWKEFKLDLAGTVKRIETRMYWKRGVGDWVGVVYRWSNDESTTSRLTTGESGVGGTTYEGPAENKCVMCHKAHTDQPIGFEAVLLAAPAATGLNYAALQAQGLLGGTHAAVAASSLQIPGTATETAALGYLHVNCGTMCHRAGGGAPFRMDIDVASGAAPATVDLTTTFAAINATSFHVLANPPINGANYYRIRPTDPMRSMISLRMDIRDALAGGNDQMPPIDSHAKDTAGIAAVNAWITGMTASPYPAPAAP